MTKPMSAEEMVDLLAGENFAYMLQALREWAAAIRAEAVAGERERCAKVAGDLPMENGNQIARRIRGTP